MTSSELARELGLSDRTVQRYRRAGLLVPEVVSPGGHARWSVEKVRRQLRELAAAQQDEGVEQAQPDGDPQDAGQSYRKRDQ